MKLCVDALVTATGAAGLTAYTEGLLGGLARVDGVELTVIGPPSLRVPEGAGRIAPPSRIRSAPARGLWRETRLPALLRGERADALLVPNPELPLRKLPVPATVVVHDVFPLSSPDLTGRAKWLRFRLLLPAVCRRAESVVCVSNATRLALHGALPSIDTAKTHVIGEGPSAFTDLAPHAPAREKRPYLLYVGELYRRKNLATLLEALQRAPELDLRIAGPARPEALAQLERALTELGLTERVRHEGFASDQQLADLHAGAHALVLPSLDEGYGRPVLDALTLGTPVIASDIPAIRELTRNEATLVTEITNPAAWADALKQPLESRQRTVTWDEVAKQFAELVQR